MDKNVIYFTRTHSPPEHCVFCPHRTCQRNPGCTECTAPSPLSPAVRPTQSSGQNCHLLLHTAPFTMLHFLNSATVICHFFFPPLTHTISPQSLSLGEEGEKQGAVFFVNPFFSWVCRATARGRAHWAARPPAAEAGYPAAAVQPALPPAAGAGSPAQCVCGCAYERVAKAAAISICPNCRRRRQRGEWGTPCRQAW